MQFQKRIIPAFLSLFIFFIYLHNLSRSVYGGDVGDLVTAAFVGGVAHPPGYPLFTFLGFLLTRMHFSPSAAFAVGLISVMSGVLGILFFYLTMRLLVKNILISLLSSLMLAFSYFFWFYSEIAEVFALNSFFFILLTYLAIRFSLEKSTKLLLVFFFFMGLSLTNHQTIVLAFPFFFLLITPAFLQAKKKVQVSILGLLALGVGFSVYVYVPIISTFHPLLNWDRVKDIPSFLHLVLRQDYGTFSSGLFVAPSLLQRFILVKIYLTQVLFQLTIPVISLCFIGFFSAIKRHTLFATGLFLAFLLAGPFFIFYAGFPLTGGFYFGVNERFFLLSTVMLFYFVPFGLQWLSHFFKKLSRVPVSIFLSVFFIIPLMLCIYNFPKTNLSTVFIGDYYGEDMLMSLPPNSLFFVAGDTTIFNAWYVHYVKGVRPDVQILNISGNIGSPYYSVLEAHYKKIHPHATSAQIQKGIIAELPQDGSVFSVEELQPFSEKKFVWIPYGLVLQLRSPTHAPTEKEYTQMQQYAWSHMHIPVASEKTLANGSLTISDIPQAYANAMLVVGNYYLSAYQDSKEAKAWYTRALTAAPLYDKIYTSFGVYYLSIEKDCTLAKDNLIEAMAINPVEPLNYLLLYATYSNCFHDKIQADRVKKLFEKQFQTSFAKALSSVK